jgi:hypothetical protein
MSAHQFILSASLALLFLTGCGGLTDPSKNKIDRFTDVVPNDGQGPVHPFTASKTGELSLKLTALSPTPSAVVGIVYGQPTGGGCGYLTSNDIVGLNRETFQFQIQKGSYCIQVYDSGYLTVAQNYTVEVSHP